MHLMAPEGSLSDSQAPGACPFPEAHISNPRYPNLFPLSFTIILFPPSRPRSFKSSLSFRKFPNVEFPSVSLFNSKYFPQPMVLHKTVAHIKYKYLSQKLGSNKSYAIFTLTHSSSRCQIPHMLAIFFFFKNQ